MRDPWNSYVYRPAQGCYRPFELARRTQRHGQRLNHSVVLVSDKLYFQMSCSGYMSGGFMGNRHPSNEGIFSGGWGDDTYITLADAQLNIELNVEIFAGMHGRFTPGEELMPTWGLSHDSLVSRPD